MTLIDFDGMVMIHAILKTHLRTKAFKSQNLNTVDRQTRLRILARCVHG